MSLRLVSTLTTLLLATSASAQGRLLSADERADKLVYQDEDCGFTIRYPAMWGIADADLPQTQFVTEAGFRSDGETPSAAGYNVVCLPAAEGIEEPSDLVTAVLSFGYREFEALMEEQIGADVEMLYGGITTLSGREASFVVYDASLNSFGSSVPLRMAQFMTVAGGTQFILTLQSDRSSFVDDLLDLQVMADTFLIWPQEARSNGSLGR